MVEMKKVFKKVFKKSFEKYNIPYKSPTKQEDEFSYNTCKKHFVIKNAKGIIYFVINKNK